MQNDIPPRPRVTYQKGIRIGGSGWFSRLLVVVVSAVVFVAAAVLSLVLLAVLFGVGLIVVGYLWWKTRSLRQQSRTFGDTRPFGDARPFGDDGRTIDMEVVEKEVHRDDVHKQ
ncbi:hypothetical protein LJ656_07345 [Paraburkholderia sp. MMS20-SJTR3]|uniref:Uncharacterized protein n=1 Tax=Paraburkholderia sejongensis TaxID=2886946 RepID=A0ABS8JRM8_9BURK|nr:hypothetical protein [Paraburkholderia sp. MMS20-SJTR3]MCC8392400.1 hypothetical protein [Paraburkholderia sp. MMS20-SJTR3]